MSVHDVTRSQAPAGAAGHLHLARHLGEMFLAMALGMAVGPVLVTLALGTTPSEALDRHPVAYLLLMAGAMTAPMVGWMLHRGHTRGSALEMAAAMLVPAVPLIALKVAGAIGGPICGSYCLASTLAMVALVAYRRDEYRAAAATGHT